MDYKKIFDISVRGMRGINTMLLIFLILFSSIYIFKINSFIPSNIKLFIWAFIFIYFIFIIIAFILSYSLKPNDENDYKIQINAIAAFTNMTFIILLVGLLFILYIISKISPKLTLDGDIAFSNINMLNPLFEKFCGKKIIKDENVNSIIKDIESIEIKDLKNNEKKINNILNKNNLNQNTKESINNVIKSFINNDCNELKQIKQIKKIKK